MRNSPSCLSSLPSSFHSFHEYLLSAHYVPGAMQGSSEYDISSSNPPQGLLHLLSSTSTTSPHVCMAPSFVFSGSCLNVTPLERPSLTQLSKVQSPQRQERVVVLLEPKGHLYSFYPVGIEPQGAAELPQELGASICSSPSVHSVNN